MATPTLLAFTRSINPGHMLMYSSAKANTPLKDLTPIGVRDEPLRGLNATAKTKADEKSLAVLQVVESAQLSAGDAVLVLIGKLLVRNQSFVPHSCNEKDFFAKHITITNEARSSGDYAELARRYALTIAFGSWAWRNSLEAESMSVNVTWTKDGNEKSVAFVDLLPNAENMFDFSSVEYAAHRNNLTELAEAIEFALVSESIRGLNFALRADIMMGVGARVYPSQEWASTEMQKMSKENWKGGKGITRTLAKLRMPNGDMQAFINDRKVGNALRSIDTWYPKGSESTPIAVEPFGANSHKNIAHRTAQSESTFGIVSDVSDGKKISDKQRIFYVASCIRGGVFGGTEE